MGTSITDLIIHPIRLRIIQTLTNRRLTTQQIAEALPDVAQATLYRHINKLAKAGVLIVVETRRVRGTVEKVYSLPDDMTGLPQPDTASISKDDHMRYFTTFIATVLNDFSRYLQQEKIDLSTDGVGYGRTAVYLSDDELQNLAVDMMTVLQSVMANQSGAGRRRRVIATIFLPAMDEPSLDTQESGKSKGETL